MIWVVNKETAMVYVGFEAWAANALTEADRYVREHGLVPLDREVTFNGDMIIWVF